MNTSEYDKIEEFHRSEEKGSVAERALSEEFLAYKVKRIDEVSDAGAARKKAPRKPKRNGVLVSAIAAIGSAAIITVAVVATVLSVAVRFRDTGYDYISLGLSVANGDGTALYGRLSNDGETIGMTELSSDDTSVRFDDLIPNMPYLFEVVDAQGKVYYAEEVRTRSPLNFYTRGESPDFLFFTADLSAFKGSGIYYPMIRDDKGRLYELPVQTDWENEASIPLYNFTAGNYTLVIVDMGLEINYEIYGESVYLDGLLPVRLYNDGSAMHIDVSETTAALYDEIIIELIDENGAKTEIADFVIDFGQFRPGDYDLFVYGVKNAVQEEIHRERISIPLIY